MPSPDELMAGGVSVARHLARRFSRGRHEVDELTQVAMIGLWHAARRYDPDHGASFQTFAWRTIAGELKRHRRDAGWTVRPPRSSHDSFLAISAAIEELTHELRRSPTMAELARRTGLSEEAVILGTEVLQRGLTAPLGGEADDYDGRLAADEPGYGRVFLKTEVDSLLVTLSPFERTTVHLRFFEDLTQSEIAARLGCSQMHVSRTLVRALTKLRGRAGVGPPSETVAGYPPASPQVAVGADRGKAPQSIVGSDRGETDRV